MVSFSENNIVGDVREKDVLKLENVNTDSMSNYWSRSGIFYPEDLGDVLVFSHLKWDFVFQRPQHLLSRCAKERKVFYIEEPELDGVTPKLEVKHSEHKVVVVTPKLPPYLTEEEIKKTVRNLISDFLQMQRIQKYFLWYYTPMALNYSRHLINSAVGVVYDCMDELSLFKGADPRLLHLEQELFSVADVAFTGGRSLYEHKKLKHHNIHPFPSSIDVEHFKKARSGMVKKPVDQAPISGPKIGFFGVIDERMDLELLRGIATAQPDWNLVILGPVVKIDPSILPKNKNIHYLGGKKYSELPAYLSGWDVAILPFALNPSTKFISPTKTPEYLAAGLPVVSTSIQDVVHPYNDLGLVEIADDAEGFVKAIDGYLKFASEKRRAWAQKVDNFLSTNSWDKTWKQMAELIQLSLYRQPNEESQQLLRGARV
jgi:UDP-galactopyranose mutase